MTRLIALCTFCMLGKWERRSGQGSQKQCKSLLRVKSQRQGDSSSVSTAECFFTQICLRVQLLPLEHSTADTGMLRVRHMKIWGRRECYGVFVISYLCATSSEPTICPVSLVRRTITGNVSGAGWLHLCLPFRLVINYVIISLVRPFSF